MSVNESRKVKAVYAADRDSRVLLPATEAYWVMGGAKRGVMTNLPKWAFTSKPAADAFIAKQGGKPATWEEALAAAQEELKQEHR